MADHEHNAENEGMAMLDRSLIMLSHMPQQLNVWAPDDDWTGIVDRKERRKLQNRQNQRKWRQRKKALRGESGSKSTSPTSPTETTDSGKSTGTRTLSLRPIVGSPPEEPQIKTEPHDEKPLCPSAPRNSQAYKRWFEATLRQSYLAGSPQIEHLIGLTRLNVHYAIRHNIEAIGMTGDWMCGDDEISIFNLLAPHHASYNADTIPLALRPTHIQLTIPHHPWLDFFPFPKMRDRLILAEHLFDDDELCHDLMAFWDTRNSQATLIVWGQSWDPRSWEVTEEFVSKWGWLLRGSPELLLSTNYWRRRRGERPLVWRELL
ncbi:bZIP transcription factor [Aspergillus stella-maris]|uniref:bZIP transcription factor n=1 Tax=Aspergillus stella-maris TaxID=1810926 RepID=UPI003CCDCAFD